MKYWLYDDLTQKTYCPERPGPFHFTFHRLTFDGASRLQLRVTLASGEKQRSCRIHYLKEHPSPKKRVLCWNTDFIHPETLLTELLDEEKQREKAAKAGKGNGLRIWDGVNYFRWNSLMHAAEYFPGQGQGWYWGCLPENPNGILWYAYTPKGFQVVDSYRYLTPEQPILSELLEMECREDWRPGLGWFFRHYPDYFTAISPLVSELTETFFIANPFSSGATLKNAAENGACLCELHNHYPAYGRFVPEEKSWQSVVLHDYPELPFPRKNITPALINRQIDIMHQHGIRVLFYFQCTGDCFRPYAEENFPEDIAVDEEGKRIPAWRECWMMNALPGSRYAAHIDAMLENLFHRHPGIDGIFMDQVCYPVEDTAHEDGMTGIHGRPAANVRSSYYSAVEKAARMLHARGKLLWLNGCFDMKVQHFADGIMAEGLGGGSEQLKYFCLNKPLLIHQYPEKTEQAMTILAYALRAGTPLISIGGNSRSTRAVLSAVSEEVFREGRKLLAPLAGRKWCFLSRPLEYPQGCCGGVFYSADGTELLITLVTPESLPSSVPPRKMTLKFSLKGKWQGSCLSYGRPERLVKVRTGKLIIPDFTGLALLRLSIDQESIKDKR